MKHSYIKGRIGGGLALAAVAALFPVTAGSAWGPERTTYTNDAPATIVTFNSIIDNAGLGDERNFVRVKEAGSSNDRSDSVMVEAGKTYEVYIYYHNNAASNYHLTAEDTRVYAYFPGIISASNPGNVGATISASNASPTEVWDEAKLMTESTTGIMMRYVEDSAKIHNAGATNMMTISEEMFAPGGTLIGYDALNGKLPGCAEYSGYITYELKAEESVAALSKTVSKDGQHFYDNIDVTVGDTVTYKITANNVGTIDFSRQLIRDSAVEGIEVQGNAVITDNATGGQDVNVELLDFFESSGQSLGTLTAGAEGWTVTYKAVVTSEALGGAECGSAKLINTAYLAYELSGMSGLGAEIGNQAALTVKVACPEDDVVANVDEMPKTGADAGEMLMTMAIVISSMGGVAYMVHGVKMMRRKEIEIEPTLEKK